MNGQGAVAAASATACCPKRHRKRNIRGPARFRAPTPSLDLEPRDLGNPRCPRRVGPPQRPQRPRPSPASPPSSPGRSHLGVGGGRPEATCPSGAEDKGGRAQRHPRDRAPGRGSQAPAPSRRPARPELSRCSVPGAPLPPPDRPSAAAAERAKLRRPRGRRHLSDPPPGPPRGRRGPRAPGQPRRGTGRGTAPPRHSPSAAPPNLPAARSLRRGPGARGRAGRRGRSRPRLASARIKARTARPPPGRGSRGGPASLSPAVGDSCGCAPERRVRRTARAGEAPAAPSAQRTPGSPRGRSLYRGAGRGRPSVRLRAAATPPGPRGTFVHLRRRAWPAGLAAARTKQKNFLHRGSLLLPTRIYHVHPRTHTRKGRRNPAPVRRCGAPISGWGGGSGNEAGLLDVLPQRLCTSSPSPGEGDRSVQSSVSCRCLVSTVAPAARNLPPPRAPPL
ncbi:translation initiation factor IF-2-like isoform X1 [Homo sapiens]|uniref:translation initiation factor IF-2-like isoform X1 n=1 Tax=Homo sapiens TaxID=9606 RepID=UPI001FB178E5|nr:translation initiation factor IF-2-like isoform X1 [Homo sapiens]